MENHEIWLQLEFRDAIDAAGSATKMGNTEAHLLAGDWVAELETLSIEAIKEAAALGRSPAQESKRKTLEALKTASKEPMVRE